MGKEAGQQVGNNNNYNYSKNAKSNEIAVATANWMMIGHITMRSSLLKLRQKTDDYKLMNNWIIDTHTETHLHTFN